MVSVFVILWPQLFANKQVLICCPELQMAPQIYLLHRQQPYSLTDSIVGSLGPTLGYLLACISWGILAVRSSSFKNGLEDNMQRVREILSDCGLLIWAQSCRGPQCLSPWEWQTFPGLGTEMAKPSLGPTVNVDNVYKKCLFSFLTPKPCL